MKYSKIRCRVLERKRSSLVRPAQIIAQEATLRVDPSHVALAWKKSAK